MALESNRFPWGNGRTAREVYLLEAESLDRSISWTHQNYRIQKKQFKAYMVGLGYEWCQFVSKKYISILINQKKAQKSGPNLRNIYLRIEPMYFLLKIGDVPASYVSLRKGYMFQTQNANQHSARRIFQLATVRLPKKMALRSMHACTCSRHLSGMLDEECLHPQPLCFSCC